MVQYTENAKLSKIEWEIIKQLRLIISNRFGNLTVKVDGGSVSEVYPTSPISHQTLKELQK